MVENLYISLEEFQEFLLNYIQSDDMNKTFKSTIFSNDPEKSELCFQAMKFGLIWAGSLAAVKVPKYIKNINEE
jgi:hypothetical protein